MLKPDKGLGSPSEKKAYCSIQLEPQIQESPSLRPIFRSTLILLNINPSHRQNPIRPPMGGVAAGGIPHPPVQG